MKKQGLGAKTKLTLRNASRVAAVHSCDALKAHLEKSRWLAITNRYRTNVVQKLKADLQSKKPIDQSSLRQYIAASAPVHCAEGWAFLGRAIDAHSRRDYDAARHFGYYAELRAAFSLLATQGIGIFNDSHFVIDVHDTCRQFNGSTHQIVWQALEYWASLKRSSDLLGSTIKVHGVSFAEWLNNFLSTSGLRPLGTKWLKKWGLDLKIFSDDREARNEASYRPKFSDRSMLDVKDSAEFVCELWSLCEPVVGSSFDKLDRHLLRLALDETFRGITGKVPAQDPVGFQTAVAQLVSRTISNTASQPEWIRFLTRAIEPRDPLVLQQAALVDSANTARQHQQVISRALLLLRMATGVTSELLREVNISTNDLKFWWSPLGEERGFWETNGEPGNLKDLWIDAETAVREIRDWLVASNATRTFVGWRRDSSFQISVLGGCERIGLWSLL